LTEWSSGERPALLKTQKCFQGVRRQKLHFFRRGGRSGSAGKELKAKRKEMKSQRKEMKPQRKEMKIMRKEMKI
jgi:ABC-type tungstate transport system permease subunit